VIDLERALFDLAEHLDHPTGDQLVAAVQARLSESKPAVARRSVRSRGLLVAAAVFVVIATSVVAVAPAREAIADWLGIGAVEVRRGAAIPVAPPTTRLRVTTLDEARAAVEFPIATPPAASAGPPLAVAVDSRVPGGLLSLRYRDFTLVEIASPRGRPPTVGKIIGPDARVDDVEVAGGPGLWVVGAHEIGYLDRTGRFRRSTIRRSGPALLWARDGVTYRVEGLSTLAAAKAAAESIR
jgi:hypothetical protein